MKKGKPAVFDCPACKSIAVYRKQYGGYKGCRYCGTPLLFLRERAYFGAVIPPVYVWYDQKWNLVYKTSEESVK